MSFATKRSMNTNTSRVPMAKATVAQSEMRQAALCITGLSFFDDITHASQCPNQRLLAVPIHLASQTVNVNVHYIGVGLDAHAPHLVQNHGASYNAARITAKILQKDKLLGCKLQGQPGSGCLPSQKIELEIEHTKASRLPSRGAVPLQQVPQPGQQLRQGEWLGQVIVAALLETAHPIIHGTPCRKDQNRRKNADVAKAQNQTDPILIGQAQVHNQNVVRGAGRKSLGCFSVWSNVDLVACLRKCLFQKCLDVVLVFN